MARMVLPVSLVRLVPYWRLRLPRLAPRDRRATPGLLVLQVHSGRLALLATLVLLDRPVLPEPLD